MYSWCPDKLICCYLLCLTRNLSPIIVKITKIVNDFVLQLGWTHSESYFFGWLHPQHVGVPRPGIKPVRQQQPEPLQWKCQVLKSTAPQENLGSFVLLVVIFSIWHTAGAPQPISEWMSSFAWIWSLVPLTSSGNFFYISSFLIISSPLSSLLFLEFPLSEY